MDGLLTTVADVVSRKIEVTGPLRGTLRTIGGTIAATRFIKVKTLKRGCTFCSLQLLQLFVHGVHSLNEFL